MTIVLLVGCALHTGFKTKTIKIIAENSSYPISHTCCFYTDNQTLVLETDYDVVGKLYFKLENEYSNFAKFTFPFQLPELKTNPDTILDISRLIDSAIIANNGDAVVNLKIYQKKIYSKNYKAVLEIVGDIVKLKSGL